jgi:L-threonylcarbamoyladenylate synthase
MPILKADSPGIVERAVTVLDEGKMVVYPTDTLYALGADATRPDSIRSIFVLKKRDPEQPISVMVSSFRMLERYAEMTAQQKKWAKALLPGKVTLVLEPRSDGLARNLSPSGAAFRIPVSPIAAEIVDSFNKPITATSVNPHGEPPAEDAGQAFGYFGDLVELYIDTGPIRGEPSSVVDLREEPQLVRKGGDYEKVLNVLGKKLRE